MGIEKISFTFDLQLESRTVFDFLEQYPMKKTSLFVLILFLLTTSGYSQWPWAKQIGGLGSDAIAVKFDNSSMYVIGTFEYNCHLDTSLLLSYGWSDMYLARYDLTGSTRLWLKQFGGNDPANTSEVAGISLITSDAIYITGSFSDNLIIDGKSVSSLGNKDAFVAKFDLNGNCIWIKRAGGLDDDYFQNLNMDSNGKLHLTYYSNSFSGIIDTFNLYQGIALVEMDTSGHVLAVKSDVIYGADVSEFEIKNDELYLAGEALANSIIIGSDTLTSTSNSSDAYIAKLDLSGNLIWAKRFGGSTNSDRALGLDFDSNNNIYLVGGFRDTLRIDAVEEICTTNGDMFLAKLNNSGVCQWIQRSHPAIVAGAYGIKHSPNNCFYITGYIYGDADFGSYHVSNPGRQLFLARYNENGNCLGAQTFSGLATGYGVTTNPSGEPFVSGRFRDTVTIGSYNFTSYGDYDAFIAKADIIDGVSENRVKENQLVIYANPSSGNFRIQVPTDVTTLKNAVLVVYDTSGKIIAKFPIENEHPHFEIPESTPGTYVIKLYQGDKSYSGRLVVE